MTRKKKGANLTYYWCPTLKTTSWDENMPCDVDIHKILDNKSGGGKKEEEELRKKLLIATKSHDNDPMDGERFQRKMNELSSKTNLKSSNPQTLVQKLLEKFTKIKKEKEPAINKTIREHNEKFKDLDDVYVIRPRFGIGGKRKKLMCPKNCCGLPVQKCGCPVSCKHCNCHEIKKLRKKLSRRRKKKKTRRKRKKTRRKRKKKRRKKKTRR